MDLIRKVNSIMDAENKHIKYEKEMVVKANQKHLNIVENTNIKKFKYYGSWLNYTAQKHTEEINSKKPKKYICYKRGSIVKVVFGVGVGQELSGDHLAIVLTKDDNPYSSTVSVIPLTSKSTKRSVSIGIDIFIGINNKLNEYLKVEKEKLDNISNEIEAIMKNEKDIDYETLSKLLKNTSKKINDETIASKEMIRMVNKYSTINPESFAIVDGICKISKLRILKPANRFDPIRTLSVNNGILDKINEIIIKNYASK